MAVYPEVDFTPIQHIEIRNGQARLAGRNLKVKMVISRLIHGEDATIDEVMEQYHLTRAEVHACLVYYYDHQAAIDEHFRAQDARVGELAVPFSTLKTRLQETRDKAQQDNSD